MGSSAFIPKHTFMSTPALPLGVIFQKTKMLVCQYSRHITVSSSPEQCPTLHPSALVCGRVQYSNSLFLGDNGKGKASVAFKAKEARVLTFTTVLPEPGQFLAK